MTRALQLVQDEGLIEVRYGAGGSKSARPTHLIVGHFHHFTSRAGDPDLHTHCVVMNVAGAPPEAQTGRYRFHHLTTDTARLYQWQLALGAAYRSELSRQLAALDLETRPAGNPKQHRDEAPLVVSDQKVVCGPDSRFEMSDHDEGKELPRARVPTDDLPNRGKRKVQYVRSPRGDQA